jgi:hypothetical protein
MGLTVDEAIAQLRQRSASETGIVAQAVMSVLDQDGNVGYAFVSLPYIAGEPSVSTSTPMIGGDYLEGPVAIRIVVPPPSNQAYDRSWDTRIDLTGGGARGAVDLLRRLGAQFSDGPLMWLRDRDQSGSTVSVRLVRDGQILRGTGRIPGSAATKFAHYSFAFMSVAPAGPVG